MIKTLQDKKHLWPCADKRQRYEALLHRVGVGVGVGEGFR